MRSLNPISLCFLITIYLNFVDINALASDSDYKEVFELNKTQCALACMSYAYCPLYLNMYKNKSFPASLSNRPLAPARQNTNL